jgi:anti-sigma-K factor RskA
MEKVDAMSDRERLEELAALQALGALEAGSPELKTWLESAGPEEEALLAELRQAATALAVSARPVAPPPQARERLLASLGPSRVTAMSPVRRTLAWLAAAAAVVLLVVAGVDAWRWRRERVLLVSRSAELTRQLAATQEKLSSSQVEKARQELYRQVLESDDVKVLFLGGKDPQPSARARVFWSQRAGRGVVVAGSLAALPPDKQYELWVFEKGKPVPAGVFDADASGRVLFESADLSAISAAQNFAVTIEPKGGVSSPTGPIVLIGS